MSVKDKDIIFFDGVCMLCNRSVRFIIKRDPHKHYLFCSLESETAKARLGDQRDTLPDSIILQRDGKLYAESSAALRICQHLRAPWPFLSICLVIPPFIRNALYRWVARNRYRWFGKLEQCPLPDPAEQDRFLNSD